VCAAGEGPSFPVCKPAKGGHNMRRHTRTAWLALAVAAAVVSLTGSASAAFPGTNGKIVFQDFSGDLQSIATINADGTGLTYVAVPPTSGCDPINGCAYSNPTWSADGTKIAFDDSRTISDGNKILVVNADGSNLRTVFQADPTGVSRVSHPTWSPDGTKIAFDSTDAALGFSSISTINSNGTGVPTVLLDGGPTVEGHSGGNFWEPAWSPDGTKIAYREGEGTSGAFSYFQISVIDVATKAVTHITPAITGTYDRDPAWSPDGSQIVISRWRLGPIQKDIVRVMADGSGASVNLTASDATDYTDPAWSPDNGLILATGGNCELYQFLASDGSGLTQRSGAPPALPCSADMGEWQPVTGGTPPDNTPVSTTPQTIAVGTTTVTFDSVSVAGATTVITQATGPALPTGFSIGTPPVYYFVETTASFGTAAVCFTNPSIDAASQLFHYEGGLPPGVNVTAPGYPDAATHTICSTPLTSLSPFAIGEPVAPPDTTKPSLTVSHAADGANGWNVTSPVAVAIAASDSGSGLAGPATCTEQVNGGAAQPLAVSGAGATVSAEGVHVIACTVSDVAGNTQTAGDTVKIDTVKPTVTYTGNLGSYTTAQTITITCSAADATPGSLLASNPCVSTVAQPASGFALGPHTLTAGATDNAGNPGSGTTTFTVTAAPPTPVTIGALCTQTRVYIQSSARYLALSAIQKKIVDSLSAALCQKLEAIGPQLTAKQKAAFVTAYKTGVHVLLALGWLTQPQATILIGLANTL
jgi:hypothetical protein